MSAVSTPTSHSTLHFAACLCACMVYRVFHGSNLKTSTRILDVIKNIRSFKNDVFSVCVGEES